MVWKHEAQRPDDMRRRLEQHLPLDQRLANQSEFVMLQIAQAAMNELGRGRGCSGGKIALFGKKHAQPAPGRDKVLELPGGLRLARRDGVYALSRIRVEQEASC